jgi:predicted site-specific integrase-resolvase
MKLSVWAKQQGLSYKTAWRMWKAGTLPLPAEQLATGTVIIKQPSSQTEVEHRDRLMRFGFEYVESALTAQNRKVIIVEQNE